MNLKNVLIIVGVIALILLIIQYVGQVRRMRQGDNFVSRGRAFVNWLLLFIIIGSIGGTVYADHHSKSDSDITETKAITNDDDEEADQVYINFDKKKARLNSDGVAPMKIIVSPNTKVKIVGHDTGKVYKTFKAEKSDGPVTIKYNFEYAAKYDIIATRGDKKVKKTITIKEQKNDSSSSSSSSVTSSSSSSSSSSKNKIDVDGWWGPKTTKLAQKVFGTEQDGKVSHQFKAYKSQNPGLQSDTFEWVADPGKSYSPLIKAIQKWCGATQDGHIGPATIKKMQKKLGTPVDGVCSGPSDVVKAFQKYLNSKA